MSFRALLSDLSIYGTSRAIGRFALTAQYGCLEHPIASEWINDSSRENLRGEGLPDSSRPIPPSHSPNTINSRAQAARMTRRETWDTFQIDEMRSFIGRQGAEIGRLPKHGWEAHLEPWVRRIEELVLLYLHPMARAMMDETGLTEELDARCRRLTWPEIFVTGSNISAVSAGKAAWSLLRYVETGETKWWRKYARALSRTGWYLEHAFTDEGIPWEGNLYGLFGLKAVTALTWAQERVHVERYALSVPRVTVRFPRYLMASAAGREDFHEHGDAKVIDYDGAWLQYLWQREKHPSAGRALWLIGPENARNNHYSIVYGFSDLVKPLPEYDPWEDDNATEYRSTERGLYLSRRPSSKTLLIAEAGRGLGKHRLHLGTKAGSHSIWRNGEWEEKDDGYTNPTANWRGYTGEEWNAPSNAKLDEEAEMRYDGRMITLEGRSWWPWREWALRIDLLLEDIYHYERDWP